MKNNIDYLFSVIYNPRLSNHFHARNLKNYLGNLHKSESVKNISKENDEHFLPFINERDKMNRIIEKVFLHFILSLQPYKYHRQNEVHETVADAKRNLAKLIKFRSKVKVVVPDSPIELPPNIRILEAHEKVILYEILRYRK